MYILYIYTYLFIFIFLLQVQMTKNSFFKKRNQIKVKWQLSLVRVRWFWVFFFLRLTKSTYTKYMCKKINNMITWVRISTIAHSFPDALFEPKYDLLTSHSVRDTCGSNLNQSRGYKISLESLLHRVQSCGQSEFPSYRSHCPLYLFRLDPINNQSIDVQSHLGKSWYAYFKSERW